MQGFQTQSAALFSEVDQKEGRLEFKKPSLVILISLLEIWGPLHAILSLYYGKSQLYREGSLCGYGAQ